MVSPMAERLGTRGSRTASLTRLAPWRQSSGIANEGCRHAVSHADGAYEAVCFGRYIRSHTELTS